MPLTVRDIYRTLDAFAPFALAEEDDNVGLLIGDMAQQVTGVLVALDVTSAVVREAAECGAQLIVTHHPLMYRKVQRLLLSDAETAPIYRIAQAGQSLIAMHTNLDLAQGGVNDELARRFGFHAWEEHGFIRMGLLPRPMPLRDVEALAVARIGGVCWRFGAADTVCRKVAICGGAGGSEVQLAAEIGADVLITGELKHHEALMAQEVGLCVLALGHAASEICAVELLQSHLQTAPDVVKWNVRIYGSNIDVFPR